MSAAAAPSRARLAPLLAALSMFGPFSIDTIFPAFPTIAADLHASPLAVQQTLSVYIGSYALMSLAHGPLSDTFGRRAVIILSTALFVLASIGCALSQSIAMLIGFRALQGVSAGAGQIVGRAIIRDCFHGADAQKLMSVVTMIFSLAPAVAPIVGGWILLVASWHGIFWALAAFAALVAIVCVAILPETHPRERRVPLSARTLATTYAAIVRDRQFVPLALAGTLNFGALFLYISSAPVFILELLHLGPQQFAWLFIPAISGMLLGAILSNRMAGRYTAAQTIGLGYAVMLTASAVNIALSFALPAPVLPWSVLPIGLHAIGISLSFPTLTLLVLDRFPTWRGAASSAQSFVSLVASALIAGVLSPLVAGSAVELALGAAAMTLGGFAAWRVYRRLVKRGVGAH